VVIENAPPEMGIVGEPILGLVTWRDRSNLVEQMTREFIMMGVEKGEVFQMQAWLWEPIGVMCTVSAHTHFLGPSVSEILNLIPIPLELINLDAPRSVLVAKYLKPRTIFTQPATLDAMAENAKTQNIDPKKLGYRTMVFRTRYPEEKNLLSAEQAANYKKIWGAEPFAMLDIVDNLLYAADCPEHEGVHVWQDAFVVETVDPKTMEPVGPGEKGRLVISNIFAEGLPLLRYMVEIDNVVLNEDVCHCGRTHTRIITPGYMK
jgi:phenylacetate-coenzyme A ligase PaaK-like adenylate-forming protein